MRRTFKHRFETDKIAKEYERQPERIANRAYANRIGNGNEQSGDGWRFRGRGIIQLTGRANYAFYADLTGLDIVNTPNLAQEPKNALLIAASYWDQHNLNVLADQNQFTKITKKINGGLNGFDDRKNYLKRARSIWNG